MWPEHRDECWVFVSIGRLREIIDNERAQPADGHDSARTCTSPLARQFPLSPSRHSYRRRSRSASAGVISIWCSWSSRNICWNEEGYFRSGRDFPWSVPVGHAVLLLIPGRGGGCREPASAGTRLAARGVVAVRDARDLGGPAADAAVRRMQPVLAAGLGRPISDAVAACRPAPAAGCGTPWRGSSACWSSWRPSRRVGRRSGNHRAVAGLPAPPPGARNVVLIVWDTVRAYNLSLYGYPRDTTPNLARWARKGVRYNCALAPAPWTYPSHSCFFTGQWPFQLNSQWKFTLDAPDPTLAEYLASRGYQTAGFAANTNCCSYETGLDRGFAHFEDYPLTPRSLLGRTVPGKLDPREHPESRRFLRRRSGSASNPAMRDGINDAFLDWLGRRRPDRPFFAFLNYFDAHEPYVPPAEYRGPLRDPAQAPAGLPVPARLSWRWTSMRRRHGTSSMARDCYDDCIAFLDDQLGRLLDELRGQGLLDNTVVIITSDHGEAFGDHGLFGHGYSVYLDEIAVPLVILSPDAPAGRVVDSPVSLRDLPATVVDQLGLSAGSPFPGRSLAAYWTIGTRAGAAGDHQPGPLGAGRPRPRSRPQPGRGRGHRGFQMSLVASGHHYIRDGMGAEQLYDLRSDPFERVNLMDSADGNQAVGVFRRMLLEVLTENPGSIEVEKAYLGPYRQKLKALVEEISAPRVAADD